MKMKIPTLERDQHLPSRVASSINREISSGRLQTGARLPTENEMAESFGVSRNVIREAVSQLRADGVIMARQGVGWSAPTRWSNLNVNAWLAFGLLE